MSKLSRFLPEKFPLVGLISGLVLTGIVAMTTVFVLEYRRQGIFKRNIRQRSADVGFDLSDSIIPTLVIFAGTGKDNIPALTDPRMIPAVEADYLGDEARIIGIARGDQAKAYPLKILTHHEIVNDTVGGQPIAITYCPLSDSAAAFDRNTGDTVCEYGVSGLIFRSNLLMYDRGTGEPSLFSQLMRQGVTGPRVNNPLRPVPLELTTWGSWKARHPDSQILSNQTGYHRNYSQYPYGDYRETRQLLFPTPVLTERLPRKMTVLGVWTEDAAQAFPPSAFNEQHQLVDAKLGDRSVTVRYDPEADSLRVEKADEGVHWMYAFWFSWEIFNPETTVYRGDGVYPEEKAGEESALDESKLTKS